MLEEALRAGVERVVYTSSVAAVGPAPRGSTADERQVFRAGALRRAVRRRQARGRGRGAAASPRRGLPVVIVNPATCFGARRRLPLVDRAGAPLPAPRDPRLRRRRAEHRRRRATSPRGHLLADERGVPGERYILGNRNFTLDRLFADLGAALSGVEPPARQAAAARGARARARPRSALPGQPADHRRRGARGVAVVGVPLDEGQARAGLEARRTTRTRCRGDDRLVPRARAGERLRAPGRAPAARAAPRRASACASAGGVAAALVAVSGDALPLPHADRPAVPVRARRARAAPAAASSTRRCACRGAGATATRSAQLSGPAPRAAAGRRRRGDLRLAAASSSTCAGSPAATWTDAARGVHAFPTSVPQRGSLRVTADRPLDLGAIERHPGPAPAPAGGLPRGSGVSPPAQASYTPTWDT